MADHAPRDGVVTEPLHAGVLARAPGQHAAAQRPLRPRRIPLHTRHRIIGAARAATVLTGALVATGCLPLLVGSARLLRPGEYTIAMAGQGRTDALSAGVRRGGMATAVLEGRAGLPGGRLESGITLLLPWTAAWDVTYGLLEEAGRLPAAAVRGHLGIVQPSFGAGVLITKSFGPLAVTLAGSLGESSERLWPSGAGPFSSSSETFYKTVQSLGLGLEYQVSPVRALLFNIVTTNATGEREAKRADLPPLGAREGRTLAVSLGLRMRRAARPRKAGAVMTALRGTVLTVPSEGRFTVGQPGIYQAQVLMDVHTRVTFAGAPAPLHDLALGRAVLIQGLTLPQPHTFLARTIELQ